ncbi:MAG TPA: LamG domain-containing protein [Tenuifilaceae bacterium]|nr:LamG domain-containing protein [Tenuifilaceae bacterium]
MKFKGKVFFNIILIALIVVISTLLFIRLNYYINSFSIEQGILITRIRWLPIIIHIIGTAFVLFIAIIFSKSIQNYTVNTLNNFWGIFKRKVMGIDFSNFKFQTKHLLLLIAVLVIGLLQTYTIWDFWGERIDENNVYNYSIGFFGGDFNPHWDGYGNLGMYILYIVYIVFSIPSLLVGKYSSLDEYAMQMFYNGYFVLVARYVFAVFVVLGVVVYSNIAKNLKIPSILILLFFFITIFSYDNIFYANFLKTDQLVGFFVTLAILFAFKSKNKVYLYFLAIVVAAAISSKISALSLVVFLGVYTLYRVYDKTITWHHIVGIGIVFIISLYIFQPYVDYHKKAVSLIKLGLQGRGGGGGEGAGEGISFRWGAVYHYSVSERLIAIYNIFKRFCTGPVLFSLLFLVFSKRYLKIVIPSILMLVLLIIPYINSSEITHYWFIPAFNLVRFLSLLAVASVFTTLLYLLRKRKILAISIIKYGFLIIFSILSIKFLILPSLLQYKENFQWKESNKIIAQRWIEKNLLENEVILLEQYLEYEVPIVYDVNNMDISKNISKVFKYHRNRNLYLDRIFKNYLINHYCKRIGINNTREVKQIQGLDISNKPSVDRIQGAYYVTSKRYLDFLNRQSADLSDKRKKSLEYMQSYYNYMLSNPLVKRFNSGRGQVVEIYHITKSFEEYHESKPTECLEISVGDNINFTSDLTIALNIKLNNYPTAWTSIISKFQSDHQNEFNLRIRDENVGQWYFGTGNQAYVCSFNPTETLPIGKWVNIIAVRDMSKGELILYVDGKAITNRLFPVNTEVYQTSNPIRIMGARANTLDGQLDEVQIWNKALTPQELIKMNENLAKGKKYSELVGYWKFGNDDDIVVKDVSGNGWDAFIKR